jgi:hypothetical protein
MSPESEIRLQSFGLKGRFNSPGRQAPTGLGIDHTFISVV